MSRWVKFGVGSREPSKARDMAEGTKNSFDLPTTEESDDYCIYSVDSSAAADGFRPPYTQEALIPDQSRLRPPFHYTTRNIAHVLYHIVEVTSIVFSAVNTP